jgi:hypothetical protein
MFDTKLFIWVFLLVVLIIVIVITILLFTGVFDAAVPTTPTPYATPANI